MIQTRGINLVFSKKINIFLRSMKSEKEICSGKVGFFVVGIFKSSSSDSLDS